MSVRLAVDTDASRLESDMSFLRLFSTLALLGAMLLVGACGNGSELRADAGADLSIRVGESPTFDGCGSDGQIQNYRWVIIEAPDLMAGDAEKVIREIESSCTFTLDATMEIQEIGTWIVELTVSDSDGNTSADTVRLEVAA